MRQLSVDTTLGGKFQPVRFINRYMEIAANTAKKGAKELVARGYSSL